MITIRRETTIDIGPREVLLDEAFGDARFAKTAERLREGRLPQSGLSFVACADDRLIGTVRLWNVSAGAARPALLLGPLAVAPDFRERGVGGRLMRHALTQARQHGHGSVLLVGDAPYYSRFGFSTERTAALRLPGPYARERFLGRELLAGALAGAHGLVRATGRLEHEAVETAAIATATGYKAALKSRAA
jgi:predicted N-acetyltransferase YhbS